MKEIKAIIQQFKVAEVVDALREMEGLPGLTVSDVRGFGRTLWSSWGILAEAVGVLLECAPASLDMAALEGAIMNTPGVLNVHDLHVWTVGSGIVACSCHLLMAEQSVRSGQQVLRAVAELLEHQFCITHTTVQVEVEGCEPNDMYCTVRHVKDAHRGHEHMEAEP